MNILAGSIIEATESYSANPRPLDAYARAVVVSVTVLGEHSAVLPERRLTQ